jgi:hypothetical protein
MRRLEKEGHPARQAAPISALLTSLAAIRLHCPSLFSKSAKIKSDGTIILEEQGPRES